MSWWISSLLSNVVIIYSEYIHRSVPAGTSWFMILSTTPVLLLYILGQFFLFKSFSGAPHWLTASVVFSLGNAGIRIVAVHGMAGHEVTSWARVLIGTAAMLGGAIYLKGGLR